MRIDSHQHFWHYNLAEYGWMTDSMAVLKKDFLPEDLAPFLKQAGFQGTVAVQARQNLQETEWLLELAGQHDFIKGVVGWVDLRSPHVRSQLETCTRHPELKGIRHVVHDEPDDYFMLLPEFLAGLALLAEFNLTYDLLLFPRHLPIAVEVVKQFPDQRFVVDHIAKPFIRTKTISPWDSDMRELAKFENVYCKVSGMVTEAAWGLWAVADFYPYLDIVFDCFGPDRLMFGSDWPVCTLSGAYADVARIVQEYLQQFPGEIQEKILGRNAVRFYNLT
ncbi:MAG: amidohydrolase family protein [Anaerolineales bacterium]|nr:amidohydrolase family protein [Anaerolineales bacterium]